MKCTLIFLILGMHYVYFIIFWKNKVATKKSRGALFTNAEDHFILDELSLLPVEKQNKFNRALWEHIADKHREKWLQKTDGFPQERSGESLRGRFQHSLVHNHSLLNKFGPNHWLQRFRLDINKPIKENQPTYTTEERKFIIEELSKPTYTNFYARSTWDAIQAKHHEKRLAKTRGFENERNGESLCSQMGKLKDRNELPDDILKRFKAENKAYTSEENNFIIEELSNPSCTSIFAKQTWDAIQAKHHEKWIARTTGFENERTTVGLRSHMRVMKGNGLLPDEVMKKIRIYDKGASSSGPTPPE